MNAKYLLTEMFSTISYEDHSKKAVKQDAIIKGITCFLFALVAFILTLLNIKSHFSVMTVSTTVLTFGMILAGILHLNRKKFIANILVALMGIIIFSYYAISGSNDGFAILWIMMIPLICMLWMGFKIGFLVSLYFQVLLIILFYTGIRETMAPHYTDIFMTRFPILYFGTFMVSTWVIYQTLSSKKQSDTQGRTDSLTKIDNRLGYNLKLSTLFQNSPIVHLNVLVFDINRLKYINDEFGHSAGDEVIIYGTKLIKEVFDDYAIFARVGGDEFNMIILEKIPDIDSRLETLREKASKWQGEKAPFLSVSIGYAFGENVIEDNFHSLLLEADKKMYDDKSRYYRENSIDRRRK